MGTDTANNQYLTVPDAEVQAQIDRLMRGAMRRTAGISLPRHLLERQPIPDTYRNLAVGQVAEFSFALEKDRRLALYPNYVSRQPINFSALRTRVNSVIAKGWHLEPADERNPADVQQADVVERHLEWLGRRANSGVRVTLRDLREQLLTHAIFYGSAFAGVRWDAKFGIIAEVGVIPRGHFEYHINVRQTDGTERTGWKWYDGTIGNTRWADEGQLVVFTNDASRSNPWGVGVLDSLYWLSFFEGVVLPMWAKWLERHAQPWAIGHSDSPVILEKMEAVLDAAFDNPNIVLPEGTTVEIVHPSSATQAIYLGFVEWANSVRREVILGSQLVTAAPQPHGSYALAKVQKDSTAGIFEDDAFGLDDCLTNTLCAWTAQMHPVAGASRDVMGKILPPRMRTSIESEKDIDSVISQYQAALAMGVPVSRSRFYELLPDIKAPTGEGDVLMPPGPVAAPLALEGAVS